MISVLFTRGDSIYKNLGIDSWDIERDARKWPGGNSIIAHPPCRAWGKLAHLAKPRPDEKELATWSILQIQKYGGVLEHPSGSRLWKEMSLPTGANTDKFGGFTISINQSWFGHKAEKKTLLYIVGILKSELPLIPIKFDAIEYMVSSSKNKNNPKKEISHKEREATPVNLANWLIEVATLIEQKKRGLIPQKP